MSLNVLNVAFPFAPVGPCAVGGAEQILTALDSAITAAGHQSLVMACSGSQTRGRLIPTPKPPDLQSDEDRKWHRSQVQMILDRTLASERIDVLHMHGFDFHEYRLPKHVPVLVTLHMPIEWYPRGIWSALPKNVILQCVSHSQREKGARYIGKPAVIENGVPTPDNWRRDPAGFALALGRICPEKNLHAALQAGSKAGVNVLIGGQVFPYQTHLDYFENRLKPLLSAGGHQFLGPLSPTDKRQLFTRAKCLLHPTLAPETSSLVAMEAMAAGVPVIAYSSGALSEIVQDGVTGFLVRNVDEMAEAIRLVYLINPERCHLAAKARFSEARMAHQYLSLYNALAERSSSLRYA